MVFVKEAEVSHIHEIVLKPSIRRSDKDYTFEARVEVYNDPKKAFVKFSSADVSGNLYQKNLKIPPVVKQMDAHDKYGYFLCHFLHPLGEYVDREEKISVEILNQIGQNFENGLESKI